MGDPHTTTYQQEMIQAIGKWLMYAAYMLLGIMAKLAVDSKAQKLTRRAIIIKVCLSIFAGAVATSFCEKFGYQKAIGIVVPTSTLLGETIIVYVMTNWKQILMKVMPSWFTKQKPKV